MAPLPRQRVVVAIFLAYGGVLACALNFDSLEPVATSPDGSTPPPFDGSSPDNYVQGGPDTGTLQDGAGDAPNDTYVAPVDAGVDVVLDAPLDSGACELGCASPATCVNGVCTFDCSGNNACQGTTVTCPTGIPCEVDCTGSGSCNKGVDCTLASACIINCGSNACRGGNGTVNCGGASCTVQCGNPGVGDTNSCSAVNCDAGTCDIECKANGACDQNVTCGPGTGNCTVTCAGHPSCGQRVVSAASQTTVNCTGNQSCAHQIDCSGTQCGVTCSGGASCPAGECCDAGTCNPFATAATTCP